VRLYASEDDYGKDIVKESFTTNNQGRVSTTNADYSVGTFYAEALMGTLRNWPATTVKGGTNDYKLILADNNVYNELVGQHWNLTDVTIGGTSVFSNVSACSKDNFLLFKKDLKVTFSEGNSICSGQTATIEQTYLPPIKGNASALFAFNSQLVYNLSLNVNGPQTLGYLYLNQGLTKIMLVNGGGTTQVVNYYSK
jgi:hypothetical protein